VAAFTGRLDVEVTVMSSRTPGTPRTGLARLARWLGFSRSPLRRGADRAEVAVRLTVLVLLVVALPVAVIAVGRWTDHQALRQARAQAAADHPVRAVLLQDSPGAGAPDPYSAVQVNWVPGRWTAPDGSVQTGDVLAPAGAPEGSTIATWIDGSGRITDPPAAHNAVIGDVVVAGTLACLGALFVLLGAQALACRALDRRRLNAWEAEWRAIGPLWTGHRT
jgi:hypothetical protein